MAGFSIDAALKSGFRLARREWKSVLAWGVLYSLFGLAVQLLSVGAALPEYMRQLGDDPEAAAQALERSAEANALITFPIMMILAFVVTALFYGAVARAILRPQDRGFFYLRFGRSELWLMLTSLALAVLAVAVILPLAIVVSIIVGVASQATGAPPFLWGLLLGLPTAAGYVYLAARFSMAWVQAFDEERFVLLDSWRLTHGQGWRIVLMLLALLFLLLIVCVVVLIPTVIVGGIVLGVAGIAGGAAAFVVGAILVVAAIVFFAAFNGVIYTAMAAPYVEVYRSLKAS